MFCEAANPTTWMLTHLRPPATVQSCEEHAVLNVVSLLATLLGLDGDWLWKAIDTAVTAEVEAREAAEAAANAPEEKPKPAPRGRVRRKVAVPLLADPDEPTDDEMFNPEMLGATDGAV
jgi:hypothetical protein